MREQPQPFAQRCADFCSRKACRKSSAGASGRCTSDAFERFEGDPFPHELALGVLVTDKAWLGIEGKVAETVTFIAGLRDTGVVAPMLIKGAMNGEAFLAYIEQNLVTPIELLFHPLKTFLRKAAERTIEGLNRCVRSYIRALDPSECVGYFRDAGHDPL
jgi:hypothetical protein